MPAPPELHQPTFKTSADRPALATSQTITPPEPLDRPSIHLDWEDWLPYFSDSSLSDNEKKRQIETLWTIVLAFVDLGWGLHNPDAPKICGQVTDLTALLAAAVVDSENTKTSGEDV